MKNKSPFEPWNDLMVRDDPFAPHNSVFQSVFDPWNCPMGTASDLSSEDRRYYEESGVLRKQRQDKNHE